MAKLEVRNFGAPWCQSIFVWQPIRRLRVLRHPDHPADAIGRCRVLDLPLLLKLSMLTHSMRDCTLAEDWEDMLYEQGHMDAFVSVYVCIYIHMIAGYE